MAARKMNVGLKVREMRMELGGRRAVVREMRAASPSSLKRWERRECRPISAHVVLVNEAYKRVQANEKMRNMVRRQVLRELKQKEMAQKKRKK